jgi:hypothetical protein
VLEVVVDRVYSEYLIAVFTLFWLVRQVRNRSEVNHGIILSQICYLFGSSGKSVGELSEM